MADDYLELDIDNTHSMGLSMRLSMRLSMGLSIIHMDDYLDMVIY